MDHAGEGQLLAYLDGELSAAERAAVSAHLAACTACAEELSVLEEASRQFAASLRLLDSVAPAPTPVEAVLARAKAERVAAVRRTLLRAAGIVLFQIGRASCREGVYVCVVSGCIKVSTRVYNC